MGLPKTCLFIHIFESVCFLLSIHRRFHLVDSLFSSKKMLRWENQFNLMIFHWWKIWSIWLVKCILSVVEWNWLATHTQQHNNNNKKQFGCDHEKWQQQQQQQQNGANLVISITDHTYNKAILCKRFGFCSFSGCCWRAQESLGILSSYFAKVISTQSSVSSNFVETFLILYAIWMCVCVCFSSSSFASSQSEIFFLSHFGSLLIFHTFTEAISIEGDAFQRFPIQCINNS